MSITRFEEGLEAKKTCAKCGAVIEGEARLVDGEAWCDECFNEARACDDVYYCNRCEEWHEERYSNSICIDGEVYCEDCVDEMMQDGLVFWCGWHEEYEFGEGVLVHCGRDNEEWCEYAVDGNAWTCEECGEVYCDDEASYHARGVGYICDNCANDFYYCNECGEYVDADEWNDEECCCIYCADDRHKEELIHNYSYKPSPNFIGNSNWFIGCELEIDKGVNKYECTEEILEALNGGLDNEDVAYLKRDGSLTEAGFEIVLHPHTEEEFFKIKWQEVFDIAKKYKYLSHDARTCGLHLHISRRRFGATKYLQDLAVLKMMAFYDIFYDEVVKVARRGKEEALRWASPSTSEFYTAEEKIKKCIDIVKNKEYLGRYRAVNTTNTNTIEVRIMRGTLNKTTFEACVKFVLLIAKNSTKITYKNLTNINEWLKGIDEDTLNYVIKRGAFLDFNGRVKKTKKEGV